MWKKVVTFSINILTCTCTQCHYWIPLLHKLHGHVFFPTIIFNEIIDFQLCEVKMALRLCEAEMFCSCRLLSCGSWKNRLIWIEASLHPDHILPNLYFRDIVGGLSCASAAFFFFFSTPEKQVNRGRLGSIEMLWSVMDVQVLELNYAGKMNEDASCSIRPVLHLVQGTQAI